MVPGDLLGKIIEETHKTQDITGGLPQIIDIFEARESLENAILAKHEGHVTIKHINKKEYLLTFQKQDRESETQSVYTDKQIVIQNNFYINKGDKITHGTINIKDIISILGISYAFKYMLSSIVSIYKNQDIDINSKHIETILKYMFKKVIVSSYPEEEEDLKELSNMNQLNEIKATIEKIKNKKTISFNEILKTNKILKENNITPIKYKNLLLGITNVATNYSDSFISSSSFQNTVKILTKAAINKEIDYLQGIKERVILGRLIPERKSNILNTSDTEEKLSDTEEELKEYTKETEMQEQQQQFIET